MEKLTNETLDNAISVYKSVLEAFENSSIDDEDYNPALDKCTLSFLEELKKYRQEEEQGLLLRLPFSVADAVDKIFSHNEIVELWTKEQANEKSIFSSLLWRGMAWDVPEEYKNLEIIRFFGTTPVSIMQADTINILVKKGERHGKIHNK